MTILHQKKDDERTKVYPIKTKKEILGRRGGSLLSKEIIVGYY
jgi:hypothetical protein